MPPDTRRVSPIVRWLESGLARLALGAHRRPAVALALVAALTALAVAEARQLTVDADIIRLLPADTPSLRDLDALKTRFGGVGYVVVVAEGAAPEDLIRFADDVAPKLEALPEVRYVEHRRPAEWFRDRALYFMETADLQVLLERIEDRATYARKAANPLLVDLADDDAGPPPLDFEDLQAKYSQRGNRQDVVKLDQIEPYYLDRASRRIALLVKPAGMANDLGYARRVVDEVQGALQTLDTGAYGGVEIALTGRYVKKLDHQAEIEADLKTTTGLALALMLLFLVVHFRRLAAVVFIVTPLLLGLVWTFGLAGLLFGELNILTGFAGAILLGLGIDHGIHLLGRYASERARHDAPPEEAVRATFAHTGRAVIVAATTTFVGFLGLSVTELRAVHEFGQMTAAGTLLVVVAYTVTLPALLGLAGRLSWRTSSHGASRPLASYARIVPRWAGALFWITTVPLFFLAVLAPRVDFDEDFAALDSSDRPSYRLDARVNELLGRSQTPLVVLTEDAASERAAAEEIRRRALEAGSGIDFVAARSDLVPLDQADKQDILLEVQDLLQSFDPDGLGAEDRARYDRLLELSAAAPFSAEDLPIAVRRQFGPPGQADGAGMVLVFPSVSLSDGERVIALAAELDEIPVPGGGAVRAAGTPMVLADVLTRLFAEAPRIVAITLAFVFASLWLLLGSLSQAVRCFLPAPVTVLAAMGLAHLLDLDLNYLNAVVVPVLFGIAVDGGVHLVVRGADSAEEVRAALEEVGRAVLGASLTTAFGFGALVLAHHPGLNSFGRLALLGLAVNAVVTLVWLAGLLGLRHVRAAKLRAVGLFDAFTGRLSLDLGTVWGAGLSPKAPGTFGAWAALPFGWAISHLPLGARLAIVAALIGISFPIATRYMRDRPDSLDPQEIVYDELIGVLIPLACLPWTWTWVIASFVGFRFFDILKPGPVGWVDSNMKGPAGVMLDDVVAGVLAALVLVPAYLWLG